MGNKKEEKWVIAYNKYKTMDFDTVIKSIEEEIAKKTEKGEDTTKLSEKTTKFKQIKENLPKIENMKNYLDKLKEQKGELEGQKKLIEDLKAAPDKMKSMEEKMAAIEADNKKLEAEMDSIEAEIKVNKDNPEKKTELEEKRKNLMKEYGNNQTKYSKYQDIYTGNRSLLEANAGQKLPSSEEIDKKLADVNKNIDKCNIICSELVEGENLTEIMSNLPALENKYEQKENGQKGKGQDEKGQDENEQDENEQDENEQDENEQDENEQDEKGQDENEQGENEQDENEPETKKGLWNKVKNWLGNFAIVKWITTKFKKDQPKITDGKGDTTTGKDVKDEEQSLDEEIQADIEQTVQDVQNQGQTHDSAEQTTKPEKKSNSFRDDLVVAETKVEEKKPEVKSNTQILQNQLLEAIAEYGEKSDKAQKIASQIKLQKYVQEKTGVVIGTKSDAARYETEQHQSLPGNSKMREALAGQDKIAVGRAYLPKENEDEGR